MIICHVGDGGAFKVAKAYSQALEQELLVRPSIKKLLFSVSKIEPFTPIIFHAPHHALKFIILIKLLAPRSKIYCVEHFILSQILKYEFVGIRRVLFGMILKVNDRLGVKPICIDAYSAKVRRRMSGLKKVMIVHNPVILAKEGRNVKAENNTYDLIWAGSFSPQKRWPEALEYLCDYANKFPSKKIAVASYSLPYDFDLATMARHNIDFLGNRPDWYSLATTLFFTSCYEGYPLVLLEAMKAQMRIVAWCHRSCYLQVGKLYPKFEWQSSAFAFSWELVNKSLGISRAGDMPDKLIMRHSPIRFQKELQQL